MNTNALPLHDYHTSSGIAREPRRATWSDVPAIGQLISMFPGTILPRTEEEICELLGSFWVIEEDGEVVGCSCLEIYGKKICELRTVIVRSDKQGRGYGEKLVQVAVDEAQRLNIPQILVVTSEPEYFQRLNFGYCLKEKHALFWNGSAKKTN